MWFIMAWQHISPKVILKGFKKGIPNVMNGTDVGRLWNCSEKDGKVGRLCEEEALTVKMQRAILIDKGTYNLTCFVY
jgi:hypothetical protein